MQINTQLAKELSIKEWQVDAAVKLLDEGSTVPFISRYRKDVTGDLNDEVLRALEERLKYLRNLEEKKAQVLSSIEEQGKLTDELREKIEAAETMVLVDDLYRPYRPKRKTRASVAKEKGLEPLAQMIREQEIGEPVEKVALDFVDPEKGVESVEDAIAGAKDIIAEDISDDAEFRVAIRNMTFEKGVIASSAKDTEAKTPYEMYYDFSEPVSKIPGHRILAINRGEAEKVLTVKIDAPVEDITEYLEEMVITCPNKYTSPYLKEALDDSYARLIAPSIERDIRSGLTETAQHNAIIVFGENLKQLLMQPPIAGHTVLGWDPGYRNGCKLAVVDPTGKVLDTAIVFATLGERKALEAKETVKKLINKYKVDLISLGNGTASRESEKIIVDLIKEVDHPVQYVIVNEAGASVYSASKLAQEEFPDFDVEQRGAASMARRLQDPLAELVKIDPKAIGVGQYQHDMDQKALGEALGNVVEDCVNRVGVDLNTASAPLLQYISGISKPIAKNIVEYREKNGRFSERSELLNVPKLGPKAYEQCAGFLRIPGGKNALDSTSVHPESYKATKDFLALMGLSLDDVLAMRKGNNSGLSKLMSKMKVSTTDAAKKIGIGEITLTDIVKELEKPSRDPREDMPAPILKSDVLDITDLKPGMELKGTIRNIVDFGAFVDIGVHHDGLVHISQLSDKYVKHPLDVVSVGDIVDVKVLSVDTDKNRISLTMKK
ncbi:MAG: RNA-binding transcriptional accessory protein [Oscillospiraceae bacterium]|nr:RNA-binding transcriptional accessory protein [Oscillospiraceae bacterium]